MRVMFLGSSAAELRAAGPSLFDAELVARHHRVGVVGVRAPAGRDGTGRFLVHGPDPSPSRLLPSSWAPGLGRSADAALEQLLRRPRADVVVTLDRAMLAAAVQLCPDRVRVVHRETSTDGRGREALAAFAGRCDAVVADSQVTARLIREATGDMPVEPCVVPHAVVPAGSRTPRRVVLAPQGSGSFDFLERGVRAFALVAGDLPDWRLRVLARRAEHETLQRLVDGLRLAGRVDVVGARTDQSREWASAGVGLLTSEAHADHPAAALAAATGVPVVAMDWPTGVRDVVDNGTTGWRVRPRSVSAMAGALLTVGSDEACRVGLGDRAMEGAARFDPEAVAGEWARLLEEGSAARGRSSRLARARARGVTAPTGQAPMATAGSLGDLVALLERAHRGWFALRDSPLVLVLPTVARERFLGLLRDCAALAETPMEPDARDTSGVLVGAAGLGTPVSHLRLHLAEGPVDVDFWDEVSGRWHAPYPHGLVRVLPSETMRATLAVGDLTVPTVAPFEGPTFRDRPFPVDVVYTWVDGADEEWQARHERRLAETSVAPRERTSAGDARYRSRDELRYSMRSLHRFAPWVRTIYLVTDLQRPAWLRVDQDRVRVVDHTEILAASALPTYNSHAIGTALHRIDGLSESFVYLNDDVFLGADVRPAELFASSGSPMVFLSPGVVGVEVDDAPEFLKAAYNNRRLVQRDFGLTVTNVLQHTPHPLTRRLMAELARRFPDHMRQTELAPFRSESDVSACSSLAQHVGLATGAAHEGQVSHRYVDLGSSQLERTLRRLSRRRDLQTFCLGDAHVLALGAERVDQLVAEFLQSYYPDPAPWETV